MGVVCLGWNRSGHGFVNGLGIGILKICQERQGACIAEDTVSILWEAPAALILRQQQKK
jgi:hypothetical protein